MKPTPSKIVLLMSAAGLGLSWSGAALAARDHHVPASVALTFGAAPGVEQGCDAQSADAWVLCPATQGELVRTITAQAAALPLPLTADQVVEARLSTPSIAVARPALRPGEAAAAGDEPAPDDRAPLPESRVVARAADDPSRDPEAGAIATVLLDDPQDMADDTAAADDVAVRAQASAAATVGDPVVHARVELAAAAVDVDAESVDRVFATLAEVLGAELDAPLAMSEAQPAQPTQTAATQAENSSVPAPALVVAEPAPEQVRTAASAAPLQDSGSLQRSAEAEEIVVAPSHADKVLMGLAALRSGESQDPAAQKTVVTRHTDKVLETLALFQTSKAKRAMACTGAADDHTLAAARWDFGAPAEQSLVGIGLEPDILLDLEPPVAQPAERPVLRAVAEAAKAQEPPAAAHQERNAIGSDLVALSSDRLDEVRGGFVTEGGLKISFGIERAVYLNGALVTTTSLNIADLSKISGGQAQVTGNGTAGSLAVVQSGIGNVFTPGTITSTAAGTIIQNSLDKQTIQTTTHINAVVNSSSIMRAMNLQSSMQSAIVNSLRR